jgi:8-oxo-dGTP pyrophosphatase MutT (NUDIX family)
MVRRHHLMGFAGDALVFPGGRIDDADRALARRQDLCVPIGDEDETGLAFRAGALRETFEESGILLARENGRLADAARAARLSAARAEVAGGALAFCDLLHAEGLVLAADLLTPFAHWITPKGIFPKRYDTMFFLAAAPADQVAAHDGEELVDSCWIAPARALAGGAAGKLEFVTRRNLEKLNRAGTVAEALGAARADRIVTVLPVIEDTPQGRRAHLPVEAGYGGPVFDFDR